jgi:cytochrome b
MSRILVWDAPTRVGHWLMAGSFAVAFVTGDSEAWRNLHVVAGYTFLATIVFRAVWGLIGTRYARFGSFVQPPGAVTGYAKSLLTGRPQHWVGHNPAGGYAILAMLILGLLTAATGILHYAGIAGDLFEEVHEAMANLALAVVAVHLVGVAVGSLAHGENLPATMVSGYKRGDAADAIRSPLWLVALVLVAWVWLAAAWLRIALG